MREVQPLPRHHQRLGVLHAMQRHPVHIFGHAVDTYAMLARAIHFPAIQSRASEDVSIFQQSNGLLEKAHHLPAPNRGRGQKLRILDLQKLITIIILLGDKKHDRTSTMSCGNTTLS